MQKKEVILDTHFLLRKNKEGFFNYIKHQLTSVIIEAGNVSIGLKRKRLRDIRDSGYFKLKIKQICCQ